LELQVLKASNIADRQSFIEQNTYREEKGASWGANTFTDVIGRAWAENILHCFKLYPLLDFLLGTSLNYW